MRVAESISGCVGSATTAAIASTRAGWDSLALAPVSLANRVSIASPHLPVRTHDGGTDHRLLPESIALIAILKIRFSAPLPARNMLIGMPWLAAAENRR